MKLRKARPLLLAVAGAAAFGFACSAPYPPGNLIAPPCPDAGPLVCGEPQDAGTSDAGKADAGTDGGMGGDQ